LADLKKAWISRRAPEGSKKGKHGVKCAESVARKRGGSTDRRVEQTVGRGGRKSEGGPESKREVEEKSNPAYGKKKKKSVNVSSENRKIGDHSSTRGEMTVGQGDRTRK